MHFPGKITHNSFTGLSKNKLWECLEQISLNLLKLFAEDMKSQIVSDELIQSCQTLVICASGGTEQSLAELWPQKFLTIKSGLLLSLPPTEDALLQYIKHSAAATIISMSSHIAKPKMVGFTSYGWSLQKKKKRKKLCSTDSSLHGKKCEVHVQKWYAGNCVCSKNNVPCFVGCHCQGKAPTCSSTIYLNADDTDSD